MNTVPGTEEASDNTDDNLSAEEVSAAFGGLSVADKLKLDAIDGLKRRGTGFERGRLLHEAICQAILEKRKCPRAVPIMAFLVQSMRSIASHERERRKRFVSLEVVAREGEIAVNGSANDEVVSASVTEMERHVQSEETVDAILNIFADDEKAQLVLMAWAEGYRGQDLREVTGLDQEAVDYAAKRIRGKMRKLYPNGWTK